MAPGIAAGQRVGKLRLQSGTLSGAGNLIVSAVTSEWSTLPPHPFSGLESQQLPLWGRLGGRKGASDDGRTGQHALGAVLATRSNGTGAHQKAGPAGRCAVSDPRGRPNRVGGRRRRRAWLTLAVLASISLAAGALSAQSSGGALAGKLTDVHSRPLDGVTLTLRNALSGTEIRTVTGKGGTYRFSDVAPGEYALEAASPQLGKGAVGGVYISAGHESRVLVAVALTNDAEVLAVPSPLASLVPNPTRPPRRSAEIPFTRSDAVAGELALEALDSIPLAEHAISAVQRGDLPVASATVDARDRLTRARGQGHGRETADSALIADTVTSSVSLGEPGTLRTSPWVPEPGAIGPGTLAAVVAISAAKLALATPSRVEGVAAASDSTTVDLDVTAEQLKQIPLPGRHWESFVLDAPPGTGTGDAEAGRSEPARGQASVTVDGASTRMAFGGLTTGHAGADLLAGPGGSEASVNEFRATNREETEASASTGERIHLETRGGAEKLHGEASLFDRQNLLGARNPFTQWVKESAPGTPLTTPVFTPFSYSPGDGENRFGAGAGGSLRRYRLAWFASFDGDQRNDPAVSTVKHPDHFFAQPSNDEMQVLSARLGLSSANPVAEGVGAYSSMLESFAGLLGPAPRTSQHWGGFGRLDWRAGERHRFALEGSGATFDSPGGGLSRASETFGNHSFGTRKGSSTSVLGKWEAFLTPNLLAVTQGSMRRVEVSTAAETPSPFEEGFNANLWGQLPQMTVDSRYGFTIGNPARYGPGSSPDERVYEAQENLSWVHGPILVKAGFDLRHSADSTSFLLNHTGTYSYSSVENFVSDALAFGKYGLTDAQNPLQPQHNCDERGKAWRDTTGQLHGLGYLPCYSYYKQTLGPTDWYLSTNDWAGFTTAQWQPARQMVMTASLRWDREELPPPIALANNPGLPQTQHLPNLGSQWSPRLGLAWGKGESRWPVLRASYGMYAGRTSNGALETALTQTGSLKGDLNYFMRPTDDLQFQAGGAPPFPYAFAGPPANVEKPGVAEFAPSFQNAEIHQGVAEMDTTLPGRILVSVGALLSLARRLPVTMDTNYDPAANPKTIVYAVVDATGKGPIKTPQITVPFFASWPGGIDGRLNGSYQQITELESRANSTYEAATARFSRNARRGLSFHARYTYGHAMDWNPNESAQVTGSSVFDPTNFALEYGTSNLDVRHSASAMTIWRVPWNRTGAEGWLANGWMLSGTAQFHSGLPYTMRTAGSITREFETNGTTIVGLGPGMNGFGGDDRVYGVGRNTYRYPNTWKADLRLGRRFSLGHEREVEVLAESFNLFNHQNVTEVETTGYSIEPGSVSGTFPTLNFLTGLKTGQTEFGQPLNINAVDFYRERQFDLGLRVRF
jgi:hypothetical protein